jgi:hypothetical protein
MHWAWEYIGPELSLEVALGGIVWRCAWRILEVHLEKIMELDMEKGLEEVVKIDMKVSMEEALEADFDEALVRP